MRFLVCGDERDSYARQAPRFVSVVLAVPRYPAPGRPRMTQQPHLMDGAPTGMYRSAMIACPAQFTTADGRRVRGDLVNDSGALRFESEIGPPYDLAAVRAGSIVLLTGYGEPPHLLDAMRDLCDLNGIAVTIGRVARN
jgi:hypothetical protein